ncbi:MAG TPA: flagellar biosynthesis protein FlhA [Fibrobacteraceae bacterium]|nr:flagellar biosynthesis protein FlhA [Fibrobacteraceae bacterium]
MESIKSLPKLESLAGHKDAIVILGVVGIVVMMIIPLPTVALDILLTLNISIALLILMISMYLDRVLDFSVFPGLLLVITLFRLALNIASTRLILSQAEAGQVIQSFGNFVTAGNLVVGTIMFLILVVIQFVVITKGSGRIAEVAARFTLDAMPGKQMAVDADLNAGIITEAEAKQRRRDISREADFYGAMDGASKFVRGDAVAGLIITAINALGGLILGVAMLDMNVSQALETYTKLTIGDGLVSQIPALMISTASGIIVTRAASTGNLGSEILSQFSQSSKSLAVAAFVVGALGLVPGMPTMAFVTISLLLGFTAFRMKGQRKTKASAKEAKEAKAAEKAAKASAKEEKIEDFLQVEQMEIEIGYGLIPLVDTQQGGDLLDRIVMLRRQMATELGIIIPPIRIRDNIQLGPNEYVIKIKGVDVGHGELMMGSYLAMNPGKAAQRVVGIKTKEPAFGLPALWITVSQKENAELAGYTVVELPAVLVTHLTELIRRHAADILTRQDVKTLVDNLKKHSPAVVEEVVPSVLGLGEIQQVLGNLLSERVSVRDLGSILETLATASKASKETVYLTEQCRLALSRQICKLYRTDKDTIAVITIDPRLEQVLEASLQNTNRGPRLVLRPDMVGRILDAAQKANETAVASNEHSVLVCAPNIRFPLKKLLESNVPNMVVLSYSEIASGINITSIANLSIHED